ncbi:RecQ family ATP-dependent DNA helicase [Halobacillus litoralis]|uniref:RecQ family ATP-dependent DNA helicase n=1 Tax=Halobacillus litoralis TaxID=45668 RepID=A0A845E2E6_9BACI|nr:ATP-dependent DNA helicase RecQ [Halobacillus litoralis]MYL48429.1 RecQ family ATP-dependent DNA helicase [Halobacillus litoralis]
MRHDLDSILKENFGFNEFREGQKEVITDVLEGEDVLGILPTGTGKSLCYQLPAKVLGGTTLVVSPLISLMVDQVKQLKATGYKAVTAVNSFMDQPERNAVLKNLDQYSLVYISPEMLQNDWLQHRLKRMRVHLFVIDEAHCISQWGHEFRTDYLKLHQIIENLGHPTVMALSATATPEVQRDIMEKLKLPHMKKRIYPMDKQNISFAVEECTSPEEKTDRIVQVLEKNQAPTMIYFSSRQWAEKVSFELRERLNQRVAFYHGGMEQTDRMLVQQQFMNNQLDVICCTSAFGMGVDKKDIRIVIHFHLPPQLESFIQEVGRAGRDGGAAASLLLFTRQDHYLPQRLIQSELPEKNDLQQVFSFLKKKQGEEIPEDDGMIERFELSESQWNFIKFQLEEEGALQEGKLVGVTPELIQEIHRFLEERWMYKHNKLNEMLKWIHVSDCRRKALYQPFQDMIREPTVPCCDGCDFSMDDLSFQEERQTYDTFSWEDRLKMIFKQGAGL